MKVVTCSPGMRGFDTATKLTTADQVTALVGAGAKFVVRYVSHSLPERRDLTRTEVDLILEAGLGLMIAIHPPLAGWVPTKAMGGAHGLAAWSNIKTLGVPVGFSVWPDDEGVAVGTPSSAVSAYFNAMATELSVFLVGHYVGYDCGYDTGDELFGDLIATRYWKSASDVPVPLPRGFCMIQTLGPSIGGIDVDYVEVIEDFRGGLPKMLVAG